MICKNCKAMLADDAIFCNQCGCNLTEPSPVAEPVPVENAPYTAPTEANPYAAPTANPYAAPTANPYAAPTANPYAAPTANPYAAPTANPYAAPTANPYAAPATEPYAAPVSNPYASAAPAPKKKKKGLLIGLIVAAVAVIAVAAVLIYLGGADGRTVEEARSLADDGEYLEALDLLDTIEDPSSDVEKDIDALKEEIYRSMENEVFALMDEGEYIKAQELLNEYDFLPSHETLAAQIKYESFILFSAFDYSTYLKAPETLKLISAELYDGYDDDALYPTVVIYESAHNGYGNDVYSHDIFFGDDLTYAGSTATLNTRETEYESMEYYVASLIVTLRENEIFAVEDAIFDLDRINSFLSACEMPDIDITQYAEN